MIRFGYGTNGFANHRLPDALDVIADLGYTGVALTLDHHHLDPYADGLGQRVAKVADRAPELIRELGEPYGEDRLADVLSRCTGQAPSTVVKAVEADRHAFSGGQVWDEIVVFALRGV